MTCQQSTKTVAALTVGLLGVGSLMLLGHLIGPSGASINSGSPQHTSAPRSPAYPDEAMDTILESSEGDFDYTFIFPEMPSKPPTR